jgi:hypothetical protein
MKLHNIPALILTAAFVVAATPAKAVNYTYGTGGDTFSISFNSVNSSLEIGDTEVIWNAWDKYWHITHPSDPAPSSTQGGIGGPFLSINGASKSPITAKSAAVFINWLNTSSGLPAAYQMTGDTPTNWTRDSGAKFFLPTVAEWNASLSASALNGAPGPVAYEWIQPASNVGGEADGVDQFSPNASWSEGSGATYFDTGFRVASNPNITPTPEPCTAVALLGGIGVMLGLRRRRE